MVFQVGISLSYICCSVHSLCFSLLRRPVDCGQIAKQLNLWIIERYNNIISICRDYYIGIKKAFFFVCLSKSARFWILLFLVTEGLGSPKSLLVFPTANGNKKFPPVLLICLSLGLHYSGWNCALSTCSLNIWPSLRQSSFNFPTLDSCIMQMLLH